MGTKISLKMNQSASVFGKPNPKANLFGPLTRGRGDRHIFAEDRRDSSTPKGSGTEERELATLP